MEGPASVLCLRTCCIKHCSPLRVTENPPELGQSQLSRSCSCSHGVMKKGQSNTASKCALPIIPEYPGFQDVKDLGRGKDSSSQPKDFSRRPLLVHCSGSCRRGSLEGPLTTSTGFQDKPLQEYFNERLMELGNYGSKWSKRRTGVFAEQTQRRSSCSAAVGPGHGQDEPCVPAHQDSPKGSECYCQDKIQNVLKLYKSDCLDVLTMHITAPLEAFVQRK
ncbi:uncharacterized protein LOC126650005 isoform X2 [Myiozetetes cayanensis]|uniref:uncharacterized protein LOC126650005 isoform X2 n=1 Tax=Myiozetetes cayanensis TaxID=478635 RepID=UPI00215DE1C7|nr:uncharacterized protein LOC126650005 isoform X2 [Myiozetetes cayanensis]